MKTQADTSLKVEPGCQQFDVMIDPEDKTVCFLYEIYSDKAAFDAHLNSEHYQLFFKTVSPWTQSKTVRFLTKI